MFNLGLFLQDDSTAGTDDAHPIKLLNSPNSSFFFSDTPSRINLIEHVIDVVDDKPIEQHSYQLVILKKNVIQRKQSPRQHMGKQNQRASPCLFADLAGGSD